jgi:charged multivesicular body protein 4
MKLFKNKKKANPKDAIAQLKETLDILEKRQAILEKKIENEEKIARANATKNKRIAIAALKRKRAYNNEIEKMMGSRMTIETQIMTIENANTNLTTLKAMKDGANALSAIHGKMNIDKVEDTMDDIREQMDLANEISDAIAQPINFGDVIDEDELNAELENLEQEELDYKLLESDKLDKIPNMPNAPSGPIAADDEEEKELEELQSSMAF